MIRTTDEESVMSPSTARPANAKQQDTTRSGAQWAGTSQERAPKRNAEFSETEMSTAASNGTTFSTNRVAPLTETHWLSKGGDKRESLFTRVVRWLSAKSRAADPQPNFSTPASLDAKTAKLAFSEEPKAQRRNLGPVWHKAQEKTESAPTAFRGRNQNPAVRASFSELPSQTRLAHLESSFPERHGKIASSRDRSLFRRSFKPAAGPDINFHGYRVDSEWQPSAWPELPSSMLHTSSSFSDHGLVQVAESTHFAATVPANRWPELGADRNAREQNWRSLMRTVQRSQRRDREQRGY